MFGITHTNIKTKNPVENLTDFKRRMQKKKYNQYIDTGKCLMPEMERFTTNCCIHVN